MKTKSYLLYFTFKWGSFGIRWPNGWWPCRWSLNTDSPRFKLWSHLHNEHKLTLLESELDEIITLSVAADAPIITPMISPCQSQHQKAANQARPSDDRTASKAAGI